MATACGASHMHAEHRIEPGPLWKVVFSFRRLIGRVEFSQECLNLFAFPGRRDCCDPYRPGYQSRRVRTEAKKPPQRMDVAIPVAIRMERQFRLGKPNVW